MTSDQMRQKARASWNARDGHEDELRPNEEHPAVSRTRDTLDTHGVLYSLAAELCERLERIAKALEGDI